MKKRIALIVCLVMVLSVSLCACSSEKDALIGTWKGTIDMAAAINLGLDEAAASDPTMAEMADYLQIDQLEIRYTLVFTEEDTYSMTVDTEALEVSMQAMVDQMADGMLLYFGDMLKAEGLDLDVEEVLAASGISVEDLAAELYDSFDTETLFADLNSEGNFKVKEGKLFLSDGLEYAVDEAVYELYTVEGSTLTINVGSDTTDYDEYLYPMVLTKAE